MLPPGDLDQQILDGIRFPVLMDTHRIHPPDFELGPVFKVTICDLKEPASPRMSWNIKSSDGYDSIIVPIRGPCFVRGEVTNLGRRNTICKT
jgi:hypothetical protein